MDGQVFIRKQPHIHHRQVCLPPLSIHHHGLTLHQALPIDGLLPPTMSPRVIQVNSSRSLRHWSSSNQPLKNVLLICVVSDCLLWDWGKASWILLLWWWCCTLILSILVSPSHAFLLAETLPDILNIEWRCSGIQLSLIGITFTCLVNGILKSDLWQGWRYFIFLFFFFLNSCFFSSIIWLTIKTIG